MNIEKLVKNQNGSNALHIAVKRGLFAVVQSLILMDFPLDEVKDNGITALGIAAYRGNVSMMERLVNAGSDPYFTNQKGIGAMYLALKGDKLESIMYLLNKNVPIHYENLEIADNSPIFYAIKLGRL